jgi:hypothetical protein
MKNNVVLIVLILVIAIGGFWAYSLFQEEGREMSVEPLSDFQIKDTANVTKIVITEKDLGSITLNKKKKVWYINDSKDIAQPYNVNLILETAFQIQIKQNVSEELKETAITQLAIRNKKVEYYFNDETTPRKIWYVGNGTSDHMGTFMLLEIKDKETGKMMRSPEPFIMFKPGVHGTLDTRFFAHKESWMYPGVFNYNVKDIASIKVENNTSPANSYNIKVYEDGKVSLQDGQGTPVNVFDTSEVRHYVTHFKELFYESFAKELSTKQQDSVLQVTPNFSFTVTETNGNSKNVRVWKIKKDPDEIALDQVNYDTGRAYASINGSKDLVKIQFFTWDVLFKPLSYFLPKETSPFQF